MLPAPDITFLYCFSLPVRKTLGSKTSKSKGEITPRVAILGRSWRFTNSGSLMAKAGVGGANLVAKNRLQLMSKGVPPTFHGKWLCWTILSCPDIICEYIWDFVNLPGKENTLAGELLVAAISHDSTHKQFDPKNYRFTDLPLFRKYLGLKIGWFFEGPHFLVLLVASIKLSTKHQTQLWLEVEMHTFTLHMMQRYSSWDVFGLKLLLHSKSVPFLSLYCFFRWWQFVLPHTCSNNSAPVVTLGCPEGGFKRQPWVVSWWGAYIRKYTLFEFLYWVGRGMSEHP